MDLYEHQGKELFARFGIPVSEGRVALNPADARAAAQDLCGTVVVKAQVLTGGRGKAGGIEVAPGPDEAQAAAERILGLDIRGHAVHRLFVERAAGIAREYYLSVTFDRGAKQPLLMFSAEGGVEIEQLAAERPEALVRIHVDPLEGLHDHHARELLAAVAHEPEAHALEQVVSSLYRCFVESDAMLCEINPLVV
ncbi:MAG: ATP-grasp domain-containing protein, partial [Actinomycetes bacterium]